MAEKRPVIKAKDYKNMVFPLPRKYGNVKTTIDGITFDSAKEARRYAELKLMEKAGVIRDLRRQQKFVLSPSFKRKDGTTERQAVYVADFTYFQGDNVVVEDTKGFKTKDYILKRKWMHEKYGVEILET